MANTSSTGGFLVPAPAPAPLEGRALLRFVGGIIAGVTGLDGSLVRPYWQETPPNIPDAGVAWCAFRIARKPSDEFPFVGRYPWAPDDNAVSLQRQEALDTLVEFYDLGITGPDDSGGVADYYAALLRDGLAIPQNREVLFRAGMGLAKIGDLVSLPVKFKNRWQYRVDLEFTINRQIDRTYPVETLSAPASGALYTDGGLPPQPITTPID